VLSNGHAGCGGRARETGRSKYRYRVLARPYLLWVRITGAGMRRRCGKPTVRGAELPGRTGCPGKQMPGGRKAAWKAGPKDRELLPDGPRITGPDAGSCYPGSKER
jgi:hypothetical protein